MTPIFPTFIDSTIRANWSACRRKFYWSTIQHQTLVDPPIHPHAGAAFARGIEMLRNLHYGMGMPVEDALLQAIPATILEWGSFDLSHEHQKGLFRVLLALLKYVEKWPLEVDHLKPLMQQGKPSVEFSFAVPLPISHPETGDPILYVGRADMLALYNDQLFVVDEKTTSQLGASWRNKWDLRAQFTGYTWAAQQYGYPVAGCIVRGISFLKADYGFEEAITYRADWQISEWYDVLLRDVRDMIQEFQDWGDDLTIAPRAYAKALDDACEAYGGCEFKRLCLSAAPREWLPVYYKERHWNPIERDYKDVNLETTRPPSDSWTASNGKMDSFSAVHPY